jgi:bifunctional protein TilS/HprT
VDRRRIPIHFERELLVGHVRCKPVQIDATNRGTARVTVTAARSPRQRQLPLPWQYIRPVEQESFAHPAEAELAKILTFYRIRWFYEPTSFELTWADDGRATESFTPDFYLPDFNLYIELTTMRQSLVTRKNRKLRQLRARYPGVRIKLLYRRDIQWLLSMYDESWDERRALSVGEPLISGDEISARIEAMAGEYAALNSELLDEEDDQSDPLLLIGLDPGGMTLRRHLANALREEGVRVDEDRMSMTRYSSPMGRKSVRLTRAPKLRVAGRDVMIVVDVVSSGLSLGYLVNWLWRHGARKVEVCALFSRTHARIIDHPVRLIGFEAPNRKIVGFGLGACAAHRRLPFVATLSIPAVVPED